MPDIPHLPRRSAHKLLVFSCVLICSFFAAQAQDKPDRGIQPANSYSISDIETVNLTNGNLMLNIPLAHVPGRGTAPAAGMTLRYDSKLWDSSIEKMEDGENGAYDFYALTLGTGGWRLDSGMYQLSVEQPAGDLSPCTRMGVGVGFTAWAKNFYQFRVTLQFPDGSKKEFRPYGTGTAYQDTYQTGYFAIDTNGLLTQGTYTNTLHGAVCGSTSTQVTASGMNYYSIDGSGTRLYVPYNANDHWTLYMPDGTKVENQPQDDTSLGQRLTDRNGNHMYWKNATLNGHSGARQVVCNSKPAMYGNMVKQRIRRDVTLKMSLIASRVDQSYSLRKFTVIR